jgi:dihydrofolate reductase
MSKVRVACFAVSVDGFAAGPNQSLKHPLGVGGERLHEWFYPTRVFREMLGHNDGSTDTDNDFALRGKENLGAWILGRNMFAPGRGPWDEKWKGWWGDNPPYHVPVFVLTHHARASIEMEGGTVFHFVTGGIHDALKRAKEAAKEKDVRIGGGAATIKQYLREKLIDELHLALSPTLLGSGEKLFETDMTALGYKITEHVPTKAALHVIIKRA